MKNLTRNLRTSLILTAGASAVACAPSLESMSLWQPVPQARAVKADLRPSMGYYENAVAAINDRHYALALEYLQAARTQKPDDVRVLTAFGVVYDKLGRFDLSARYYAQALTLDPKSRVVAADMDYSRKLQGISSASPPVIVAEAGPAGAQIVAVPQKTPVLIADNVDVARASMAPTKTATISVRPATNADIPAAPKAAVVTAAGVEHKHATSDIAGGTEIRPAAAADVLVAPKPAVVVATAVERNHATSNIAVATEVHPATNSGIPAVPKPSVANAVDARPKAVTPDKVATAEPRLVSEADARAASKPSLVIAAEAGPKPVTVEQPAMVEVRPTARSDAPAPPKPGVIAAEIERKPAAPGRVAIVEAPPTAQMDVPVVPKPSLVAAARAEHKSVSTSDKATMAEVRPATKVAALERPKSVVIATEVERKPAPDKAAMVGARPAAQIAPLAPKPSVLSAAEAWRTPVTLNKTAPAEVRPVTKSDMPAAPKPMMNAAGAGRKLLALIKLALVEVRAVVRMDAPAAPKPAMMRTAGVERKSATLNKFVSVQAETKAGLPAVSKSSPANVAGEGHEPNKAAMVEVRPVQPAATKPLLLTGYPLSIVDASGGSQVDKSVKAYLSGKGWSVAKGDSSRLPARTETTIIYRETMVEAARALARTLSLPVRLNASDNVQGLQLVLGTDFSGIDLTGKLGRAPNRQLALAAVKPKAQE